MKDLWSIVLGAVLALVGTVLVQSWIVPRTQRRIRQRERWEKDVRELADLLAKTLPPRLHDLSVAMRNDVILRLALADSLGGYVRSKADDAVDEATEAAEELQNQFDEQIDLIEVLVDRVRRLNKDSDGWIELRKRHDDMWKAWAQLYLANSPVKEDPSPDEVDSRTKDLKDAILMLSDFVERLAEENRPPQRPSVLQRIWRGYSPPKWWIGLLTKLQRRQAKPGEPGVEEA
jgi:hypothetical protein